MSSIASVENATSPAAQAVAAGQAATGTGLSAAQAANTVDAELVSSQWGVDPAAGSSGGLFAGDSLLPMLTNLTHSNAAQALSLIGIQTPTPASLAAAATGTPGAEATKAYSAQNKAILDQGAASGSGPAMIDPLWGKTA